MIAVWPVFGSHQHAEIVAAAHELFDLNWHRFSIVAAEIGACRQMSSRIDLVELGEHRGYRPAHIPISQISAPSIPPRSGDWPNARLPWRCLDMGCRPNERLVGLGYTLPWLSGSAPMPSGSLLHAGDARGWFTPAGPTATALVFDEELPLVDLCIDRMLVHSLEHVENPRETQRDMAGAVARRPCRHRRPPPRRLGALSTRLSAMDAFLARPAHRNCCARRPSRPRPGPTPCSSRHRGDAHDAVPQCGTCRPSAMADLFRNIVVEAQKRLRRAGRPASRRVLVPVLSPQGANRLGRLPQASA
jgi:hypothetical protein